MSLPPPIPYVAPVLQPAQAAPQMTPEHFRQIAEARTAWKRIRRAVGVARFDGWTIGLFGGLTVLFNLVSFSASGLAIGLGMVAVAAIELWGAARISRLDPRAPRVLGFNQVAVALMLTVYALWSIYAAAYGPPATSTLTADEREAMSMLGPVDEWTRQIQYLVYGLLIVVAVFGQGALALYYFTRARHVRDYLLKTPPWIADMQRAGVVL